MADEPIATFLGKPQVRKTNSKSFTVTKRKRFLDALALTCNVTKSAEYAAIATTTLFRYRVRDKVFAGQWDDALAMGYDRLEALVLQHGGAGQPIDPDPDAAEAGGAEPEPFDFDRAMKVLIYRRNARAGLPTGRGKPAMRNASREETNAVLMKALAAAKRRVDAGRKTGCARDE